MTREQAIYYLQSSGFSEEQIATIERALEQEPKWIPVSERLPEKEGQYLTTIINEYDNRLRYIMTCDYFPNARWCPDDECASSNVVAWMPLPKPYEPQESEDKE